MRGRGARRGRVGREPHLAGATLPNWLASVKQASRDAWMGLLGL